MNKAQLVAYIAEHAELAVSQSAKVLDAILDSIQATLTEGGSVSFVGFGNFGVKERAARKVRNPQTGKEMQIKATIVPFFKAGKGLKEEIDSKK